VRVWALLCLCERREYNIILLGYFFDGESRTFRCAFLCGQKSSLCGLTGQSRTDHLTETHTQQTHTHTLSHRSLLFA
jgi:hypothetical protein